jgi:hypothetical protein
MKIGRGNRSTQRKPTPAPLCPPQIPLDQTWDRTRAAMVGSEQRNRLSYGVARLILRCCQSVYFVQDKRQNIAPIQNNFLI